MDVPALRWGNETAARGDVSELLKLGSLSHGTTWQGHAALCAHTARAAAAPELIAFNLQRCAAVTLLPMV